MSSASVRVVPVVLCFVDLRSLAEQDRQTKRKKKKNTQVILVNDHSLDDSWQKIRDLKKKYGFIYNYVYLTSIFFSAISSVNFVISLIDLSFALMAIPNMISVIYLSKLVKQEITKTNFLEVR